MKVKICGITTEEEIGYCNTLLPDYIGFVFAESKRSISVNQALKLKILLDKRVKTVGVFVNEDIEFITKIAEKGIMDLIQLHGDESDTYIRILKEKTGLPIIKAYRISRYADYVLYDGIRPGSGNRWEWKTGSGKPFFLAGGLRASDIARANKLNPYALDVSSGVESGGRKDYALMKEFIGGCRNE